MILRGTSCAGPRHSQYGNGNSFPSLLMKIEYEVFKLIIAMPKCQHSIRVPNALQYINELVTNTEYQLRLN